MILLYMSKISDKTVSRVEFYTFLLLSYAVLCCAVLCRAVPCCAVPCRAVPCRADDHAKDLFTLFFFSGNTLLYLDPHVTQQIVEAETCSEIPDQVCFNTWMLQ